MMRRFLFRLIQPWLCCVSLLLILMPFALHAQSHEKQTQSQEQLNEREFRGQFRGQLRGYVIWPQKVNAPLQTAVVSWSDWLVFSNAHFGKPGVRMILNEMAATGIREVWWRTFGGGWSLYSSKVDGVTAGNYPGQGADYSTFDSLAEAVAYGHQLGMKVHAWFTPLEEAHGWPDNVRSHYVDAHPQLQDSLKNGTPTGTPSFFYKAYRDYKLALATEMIERYDVDGLVLDFERLSAPTRSNQGGYIPQLLKAFKRKTSLDAKKLSVDDARWMRFRAGYVGQFVKDVHEITKRQKRRVPLTLMFLKNHLLTAHVDAQHWAKMRGVDQLAISAHGKEGWASPNDTMAKDLARFRQWGLPVQMIVYAFKGHRAAIQQRASEAVTAKVDGLIWFESTYLHFRQFYDRPLALASPHEATLQSLAVDLHRYLLANPGGWGPALINRIMGNAVVGGVHEIHWHLQDKQGWRLYPSDDDAQVVRYPNWAVDFAGFDYPAAAADMARQLNMKLLLVAHDMAVAKEARLRYPSQIVVLASELKSGSTILAQTIDPQLLAKKWLATGEHFFRRRFTIHQSVKQALLTLTAQSTYTLYLDGQRIGRDTGWWRGETYDVTDRLTPGSHVLAVKVTPGTDLRGLLLNMKWIDAASGQTHLLTTDTDWKVTTKQPPDWQKSDFDDASWSMPSVVGISGIGPRFRIKEPWRRLTTIHTGILGLPTILIDNLHAYASANTQNASKTIDGVLTDSSSWQVKHLPSALTLTLDRPTRIREIRVHATCHDNATIKQYRVQAKVNGKWIALVSPTQIKTNRACHAISPQQVQQVQLVIENSGDADKQAALSDQQACWIREIELIKAFDAQ